MNGVLRLTDFAAHFEVLALGVFIATAISLDHWIFLPRGKNPENRREVAIARCVPDPGKLRATAGCSGGFAVQRNGLSIFLNPAFTTTVVTDVTWLDQVRARSWTGRQNELEAHIADCRVCLQWEIFSARNIAF